MKTLEIEDAKAPLAHYVRRIKKNSLLVTVEGKPVAALVPIENRDRETAALSVHPQFTALIERSRRRQRTEGGISSQEMRRRLKVRPAR